MELRTLTWGCTLFTQISLCFALVIAFNIARFESFSFINNPIQMKTSGSRPPDLYFLSVRGGSRSLQHQSQLLKQMEKVSKIYHVKFIINISEFGEEDPLMQNGSLHFGHLNVPWYTTNALRGQGRRYFLKQILLQQGRSLDIIVINTRLLQSYLPHREPRKAICDQLNWLTAVLEASESNWLIVTGLDPLLACEDDEKKTKKIYEPLHNILLKFGVNAYLSKQGCAEYYIHDRSIAHFGNPSPSDKAPLNGSSIIAREMHNGFFLHRVGLLEMVSYFIKPTNEVVFKSTLHQRGKEIM